MSKNEYISNLTIAVTAEHESILTVTTTTRYPSIVKVTESSMRPQAEDAHSIDRMECISLRVG